MLDLFNGIITSKTKIKILIRLFLNPDTRAYLRELTKEFKVSSNSVREELNQLMKAKLICSFKSGRNIYYSANPEHPLFPELKNMVKKVMGIDQVVDGIVARLGNVEKVYLIDDYADGKDTGIIDILLVGDVDVYHLNDLSNKTEQYIKRKVRSIVMSGDEFIQSKDMLENRSKLLLWENKGN